MGNRLSYWCFYLFLQWVFLFEISKHFENSGWNHVLKEHIRKEIKSLLPTKRIASPSIHCRIRTCSSPVVVADCRGLCKIWQSVDESFSFSRFSRFPRFFCKLGFYLPICFSLFPSLLINRTLNFLLPLRTRFFMNFFSFLDLHRKFIQ